MDGRDFDENDLFEEEKEEEILCLSLSHSVS